MSVYILSERCIVIYITGRQAQQNTETTIPASLLLVHSTCNVNEAMLLDELTPLLKESIELWEADACLDVAAAHENAVPSSRRHVPRSCNRALENLHVRRMAVVLWWPFTPASAPRKASSFIQCPSAQSESVLAEIS